MMNQHQVSLVIGQHTALVEHATTLLLQQWCDTNGCKQCVACKQVLARQYHNLYWLTPEKQTYTVAQLEPIAMISSLQRSPDDKFYFVIEQADMLSLSSAHQLLKILEEPPCGYFFILLAERADMLLPTIVSRCVVQMLSSDAAVYDNFIQLLLQPTTTPTPFMKEFERRKITEYETRALLDQLLRTIKERYQQALQENNSAAIKTYADRIALIEKSFVTLPMPGSAKIFWRNLYLQMHACLK